LGDAQSATPVATPFELLEDLRGLSEAFDEWLELERSHVAKKIREALEARMARAVAGKASPEQRAAEARVLIGFDPTHEEACRMLMVALHEMDQPSEAVAEYNRCKNALWRQLGTSPSRGTQLLADGIRAKAAASAVSVQQSPSPGSGRQGAAPLGRQATIDVAPVQNLTDTQKYNVVAAGLSEDLLTALALLAGPFKVTEVRPGSDESGPNLVRFGVKASIQVAPQGFRLNIRLIDHARNSTVWSDRYECPESTIVDFH